MNILDYDDRTKKYKACVVILFNFMIIFFSYCGLLHVHYATDTYSDYFVDNYFRHQLNVGRYTAYIILAFLRLVGIDTIKNQQILALISIVILMLASVIIFYLFNTWEYKIASIIGIDISILICFVNVFSVELYLFPEYTIVNAIGVLMTAFAIYALQKHKYFVSGIVIFASLGIYQANISIYLIILLGLYIMRKIMTKILISGLSIAGIASIINIILQRIFVNIGIAQQTIRDAQLSLKTIAKNCYTLLFDNTIGQRNLLINTMDLLPHYSFAIVVLTLIIFILFSLQKTTRNKRNIIEIIITIVIMYIAVYSPHFISGFIWLSPRTITALFFFLGILAIIAIDSFEQVGFKTFAIGTIMTLFFMINIWSLEGIIVNHFATNKIDQSYAFDIYNEILMYEKNTGNEVRNIAPINDIEPLADNKYVDYYAFNMNERAYINEWSDVNLINFVSGRNFNRTNMNDIVYNNVFAEKNWDYYCPSEQLYFEGETLYWCKY